jgi:hypothetical protein
MKNSIEHNTQVACVNWFRYQYPKYLIYAIPNGGQRNKIVAGKLKDEGVLAGVPDLHIPVAKKGYHGLYIEMKAEGNTQSPRQVEVMERLRSEGYLCEVAYGFDEFEKIVNKYLN